MIIIVVLIAKILMTISLVNFVPLHYHQSYFLAATLDLTTFSHGLFCIGVAPFFYRLGLNIPYPRTNQLSYRKSVW